MNIYYNKLQNKLKDKFSHFGYNLNDLGINEYAYRYEDILNIIDFVRLSNGIILGGDVYQKTSDSLEMTGDSWYYNCDGNCDSAKSITKSTEYITKYYDLHPNCLYSIVVIDLLTSQIKSISCN